MAPGASPVRRRRGSGRRDRGLRARERVLQRAGEHGVYVAGAARGRGVGQALLRELCEAAERAGYYKLTSRIFTTNAASRASHVATGFEEVGVQRRHGRLDGEWRDCVLVERLLGDAA